MKKQTKILTMTALLLGACYITYIFHVQFGEHAVFTHSFYIPIIMAILWWGRRGFIVTVLLSIILLSSHLFFMGENHFYEDVTRSVVFLFVGLVTFSLTSSREKSRQQLLASETRFRNLFESMGEGVIICESDGTGREFVVKDINPAGKDISRLQNFVYQDKNIREVFPGANNTQLMAAFRQVWSTGRPIHIPDTYYCDERTAGWRTRYVFQLPTGEIVCMYRDVTERKKTEKGLLLLAKAIEQTCEAVIIANENGIIEYVNRAFEIMTGYTSGEVIGQKPGILRSGDRDEKFYENLWADIKDSKPWSGRLTNKRKDKTLYEVWTTISPVKVTDETLNFVFVQRDITEETKAENALRQAQKMEAIGTLAGGIAHDLNNTLFPIMGHAELAMEYAPENNKVMSHLQGILIATERARDLVRQILTFSRKSDAPPHPLLVQPIVEEAVRFLRASIPNSVTVSTQIDEDCGPILADPTHIHQIVLNLCTNAYHAVKETSGAIEIALMPVEITSSDASAKVDLYPGQYICLKVIDNGTGMPPEIMEHIFEPFFTTKKIGEGTGLGLSVVHGIVEKYKGVIKLFSEPGNGTSLEVYFPRINGLADVPTPPPFKEYPKGTGHILLVDDENIVCRTEQLMLESVGYRVTVSQNPVEALATFSCNPDDYDMVVTDYNMPQLSGVHMARQLKKIRSDIPILMLTGLQDFKLTEALRHDGVDRVAWKPMSKSELANIIAQIMGAQRTDETGVAYALG
jgi:PAS domain S-box-containing protein